MPFQRNHIIGNTVGIVIDGSTTTGNIISANSIWFNDEEGIILRAGANDGISPPTITLVTPEPYHVIGSACANCTVEIFMNPFGEREYYLDSTTADTNGDFNLALSSLHHPFLTATATDTARGTSAFSAQYLTTPPFPWPMFMPAFTNMGKR